MKKPYVVNIYEALSHIKGALDHFSLKVSFFVQGKNPTLDQQMLKSFILVNRSCL